MLEPDLGSTRATSDVQQPVEGQPSSLQQLREFFAPMFAGSGGIDSWLGDETPQPIVDRLLAEERPLLSRAQLSQLLVRGHEAGVSEGFFNFYWKTTPNHVYDVTELPGYDSTWVSGRHISSLAHLRWGFYRFYVDALLFFGNVRTAYRTLRGLAEDELQGYFARHRINTQSLVERGPALPLKPIAKDHRYLIAEIACKTLVGGLDSQASSAIRAAYDNFVQVNGQAVVSIEHLLAGDFVVEAYGAQQQQFQFAADDLLTAQVQNTEHLDSLLERHADVFAKSRLAAIENTRLYLSMVEELDVYVATSMRTRQDFRDMASFCEKVFGDEKLTDLNIRYFDPTMSAAEGHVDKGLIECLMVKAAKVLVYFAGSKDSFGKDVEAAMALSQGKPAIFLCDDDARKSFYRDVHPLARLINFDTGVPVGAMVTSDREDVIALLNRIFRNEMEYELEQNPPGYLLLKESKTGSTVRLQTNDVMLRETFWNYYNLPK